VAAAGDPIPADCTIIEVHLSELKQLFNAIDPSPFREKDLDEKAEEFIVEWAKESSPRAQLALVVYLDRPVGLPDEAAILRDAIRGYFTLKATTTRQRLRELFRVGRTSLLIGTTFLAISLLVGDFIADILRGRTVGELVRESLLIGGWVAMWRPLEIFLYSWWPIRDEARLFDRLATMPVRIAYTADSASEAWRWDWPAVAPGVRPPAPRPTTP
jgi:hypothetical protein